MDDHIKKLLDKQDYLKHGFVKNIVVYDREAKAGEFTDRLKNLMQETMRVYYNCKIDSFLRREFSENWDEVEIYYRENLDGVYAKYDDNLVVGVCDENEHVILGSF